VPYHLFKIAQTVISFAPDLPPAPVVIVRLLPQLGDEPHYRVACLINGHQTTIAGQGPSATSQFRHVSHDTDRLLLHRLWPIFNANSEYVGSRNIFVAQIG
jgi:hypothetical protein